MNPPRSAGDGRQEVQLTVMIPIERPVLGNLAGRLVVKILIRVARVKELSVPVPVPRRSAPAVMPAEVDGSTEGFIFAAKEFFRGKNKSFVVSLPLEPHGNWPHRTMSGMMPTMKIESLSMSQTTVCQLYPSSRGRCLYAKVLGAPVTGVRTCVQTGQQVSAADVLLGDETGCVYLTATGPHLALLQPGKSVVIRNFRVRTLRNHLRLFLDRWGSIGELQPGLTCEVNELNNRSCVEFIQIKGDSDSSMSTEGK